MGARTNERKKERKRTKVEREKIESMSSAAALRKKNGGKESKVWQQGYRSSNWSNKNTRFKVQIFLRKDLPIE